MKFCSTCGQALVLTVPPGEDRQRACCVACGSVHYQNPKTVVGCLVEHEERVLLCRRAIEPARGRWTLPAGFLELDESLPEGAARETREEACAEVEVLAPHAVFDLLHIGQIYALFRARLLEPEVAAGSESLEVRWFAPGELPFSELAFPVIHFALERYLEDRAHGVARLHQGVLRWSGQGSRFDAVNYALDRYRAWPITT
jgi:ADP-ribose pyrophosphatase YjhB (NUDIX family)